MLVGAHISAAGGAYNAPVNAHQMGAETYQFFSRSPRGGKAPKLDHHTLKKFQFNNRKYKLSKYYIHAPYYINLASSKNKIFWSSVSVLQEELQRGSLLKAQGMMFHIGSAKDLGHTTALKKSIKGIEAILKNYRGSCQPLLEISAGAGLVIGDNFKEIAQIIKGVETKKTKGLLGVCFDTAHAFASGYDLRDKTKITKTFNKFHREIGLHRLKLIHANDSMSEFNSHKDRHAHIGQGYIGKRGFKAMINYFKAKNKKINFIVETPTDNGVVLDIKLLKKFRDK